MISIFRVNTMSTCRLCLGNTAVMDIFFHDRRIVLHRFLLYSKLKMQKHDGLPENICLDCVLKMEATVNFIKKCEESDRELRSNIKQKSLKKRKLELFNDLMSFTVDDEPSTSAAVQVTDDNHLDDDFNMLDTYDDSDKDSVICLDDEDYFGDAEVTKDLTEKSKEIRHRRLSEETGSLCNICGQHFPFGQITQFNSHLLGHGDKNFKCDTCRKAFYTKKSLNVHVKIHVATKEFACEICGKTFARGVGLREHVKYVHMKEKEFPCEFCNKTFYRPDYFKKHLSVVHKKEQNYLCKTCNESFPFLNLFQEHNLIHKGQPDFHCQHCDDKFHTEKLLLEHERSHTEETPYTCPTCFAGFLRPHQLKKHVEKVHKIEIDFEDLVD